VPGNGGGRAPRPGLDAQDPAADQSEPVVIVADEAGARSAGLRLAHRLAVSRYGRRAVLRPSPTGPATCSLGCPYCRRWRP
jgi:hypothetical protein